MPTAVPTTRLDTLYIVTRNGYILTEKQEIWSDSLDYYRAKDHVILRRDLQLDDTEHKVLAFGDYGEYWKEPGDAILTRRPAVVSYDLSQGDSLFMRADSMFLFTINENALRRAAEAAKADSLARVTPDSTGGHPVHRADSLPADRSVTDSPGQHGALPRGRFRGAVPNARLAEPSGTSRFAAGTPIRWPFRRSILSIRWSATPGKPTSRSRPTKAEGGPKSRCGQGQEGKTGGDRQKTPG